MRIIILTFNYIYSNKILKDLISKHGEDIKLIIEPSSLLKGKTQMEGVFHYLKVSGLYYTLIRGAKLSLYLILSRIYSIFGKNINNKFFSYRKLARIKKIKMSRFTDINFKQVVIRIKKLKPDLIISAFFTQIIKKEIINIPALGVINIHPAFLPNYKGVSPIFWSLLNGEKYVGISVHYIDEGIDTGRIINRRKIKITRLDTEDTLYWKCVEEGEKLLEAAISNIRKKRVKTLPNTGGKYYSFPTSKAVNRFRAKGKSFVNFKDYLC